MKKSTLSLYKIMGKFLIEFRTIKISPRGGFMSRGANTVRLLPVVIIVYPPTGVATRIVCTLTPLTVSGLPSTQLWNLGLTVCMLLNRSKEEGGGGVKEKEKKRGDEVEDGEKEEDDEEGEGKGKEDGEEEEKNEKRTKNKMRWEEERVGEE